MYSDMSIRTIARSSSNRNSASARAVSVLPTPVGPRKMNEPMGRLGSCSPARLRRTALATAVTACALADDPLGQLLLQLGQPLALALHHRVTGMPVHFDTISAMSSASTSSLRYLRLGLDLRAARARLLASRRSSSGMRP